MKQPLPAFTPQDIEENKFMAALSYLSILVIIPIVVNKKSPFIEANVKQGIVLLIISVLAALVRIPVLWKLVSLAVLVVAIMALIDTLRGKFWAIPGIYDLSQKFKL